MAQVRTMEQVVRQSTAREDFNMTLLTIFGCAALLLAAIGIYGLMAYAVEQRRQEFGIRMALGAATGHVRNMIVWQDMRLALAGVLVFVSAPVLLSAVALLAVWVPALRATRIDPAEALRCE